MSKSITTSEPVVLMQDTVKRIVKDVKEIMKNPLTSQGIFYEHSESDLLRGYAMIIGPSDTPYEDGFYFFEFNFPPNYPYSPPTVSFCTGDGRTRFNPNLYVNGKVCVSILNTWRGEGWTSCQTISSVLLSICTLLCNDPILNEPGVDKRHKDFLSYNDIIEYKNLEVAVCGTILRLSFDTRFEMFYPIALEHFKQKYEKLLAKVQDKMVKIEEGTIMRTGLYNMTVKIKYAEVLDMLRDCEGNIKLQIKE